jgi:hypothetical protein
VQEESPEEARAAWEAWLASVEHRLAVQAEAVRGRAPAPRGPEPVPPPSALPPELAGKARRLLAVTRALEELGHERRARLAALRRALRARPAGMPLYVDERA